MRNVERRVVLFEEITKEVLKKHGNQWNSRRYIDVGMLKDEIECIYGLRVPTAEEVDDTACFIYEQGIMKPCIVLAKNEDAKNWDILWDDRIDWLRFDGPIIFNASIPFQVSRAMDIQEKHRSMKDDEYMLSWTHLDSSLYSREGWYIIYKQCPLSNSRYSDPTPIPAKTVTFAEMAKKLGTKRVTLDGIRKLPTVTIADLSNGYMMFHPNESEPCFLMIGDKILCNRYVHGRLPYLYNAEGCRIDSYTKRKEGDRLIYEHEWDVDAEIAARFKKAHIEEWR